MPGMDTTDESKLSGASSEEVKRTISGGSAEEYAGGGAGPAAWAAEHPRGTKPLAKEERASEQLAWRNSLCAGLRSQLDAARATEGCDRAAFSELQRALGECELKLAAAKAVIGEVSVRGGVDADVWSAVEAGCQSQTRQMLAPWQRAADEARREAKQLRVALSDSRTAEGAARNALAQESSRLSAALAQASALVQAHKRRTREAEDALLRERRRAAEREEAMKGEASQLEARLAAAAQEASQLGHRAEEASSARERAERRAEDAERRAGEAEGALSSWQEEAGALRAQVEAVTGQASDLRAGSAFEAEREAMRSAIRRLEGELAVARGRGSGGSAEEEERAAHDGGGHEEEEEVEEEERGGVICGSPLLDSRYLAHDSAPGPVSGLEGGEAAALLARVRDLEAEQEADRRRHEEERARLQRALERVGSWAPAAPATTRDMGAQCSRAEAPASRPPLYAEAGAQTERERPRLSISEARVAPVAWADTTGPPLCAEAGAQTERERPRLSISEARVAPVAWADTEGVTSSSSEAHLHRAKAVSAHAAAAAARMAHVARVSTAQRVRDHLEEYVERAVTKAREAAAADVARASARRGAGPWGGARLPGCDAAVQTEGESLGAGARREAARLVQETREGLLAEARAAGRAAADAERGRAREEVARQVRKAMEGAAAEVARERRRWCGQSRSPRGAPPAGSGTVRTGAADGASTVSDASITPRQAVGEVRAMFRSLRRTMRLLSAEAHACVGALTGGRGAAASARSGRMGERPPRAPSGGAAHRRYRAVERESALVDFTHTEAACDDVGATPLHWSLSSLGSTPSPPPPAARAGAVRGAVGGAGDASVACSVSSLPTSASAAARSTRRRGEARRTGRAQIQRAVAHLGQEVWRLHSELQTLRAAADRCGRSAPEDTGFEIVAASRGRDPAAAVCAIEQEEVEVEVSAVAAETAPTLVLNSAGNTSRSEPEPGPCTPSLGRLERGPTELRMSEGRAPSTAQQGRRGGAGRPEATPSPVPPRQLLIARPRSLSEKEEKEKKERKKKGEEGADTGGHGAKTGLSSRSTGERTLPVAATWGQGPFQTPEKVRVAARWPVPPALAGGTGGKADAARAFLAASEMILASGYD